MKKLTFALSFICYFANAQNVKYYDLTVNKNENLGTEKYYIEKIEKGKKTISIYLDNLKETRVNSLNRTQSIIEQLNCQPLNFSAEFTRLKNYTNKITELKPLIENGTLTAEIINQTVKIVDDEIIFSVDYGKLKTLLNECTNK